MEREETQRLTISEAVHYVGCFSGKWHPLTHEEELLIIQSFQRIERRFIHKPSFRLARVIKKIAMNYYHLMNKDAVALAKKYNL